MIDDLRAKLAAVNATLDAGDYTLNCDAPSGYIWVANSGHTIAIHYATNSQSWLAKAIREDGLPRLKMGLMKVIDPDTIEAMRHDLDDDTWGAPMDAPEWIKWP